MKPLRRDPRPELTDGRRTADPVVEQPASGRQQVVAAGRSTPRAATRRRARTCRSRRSRRTGRRRRGGSPGCGSRPDPRDRPRRPASTPARPVGCDTVTPTAGRRRGARRRASPCRPSRSRRRAAACPGCRSSLRRNQLVLARLRLLQRRSGVGEHRARVRQRRSEERAGRSRWRRRSDATIAAGRAPTECRRPCRRASSGGGGQRPQVLDPELACHGEESRRRSFTLGSRSRSARPAKMSPSMSRSPATYARAKPSSPGEVMIRRSASGERTIERRGRIGWTDRTAVVGSHRDGQVGAEHVFDDRGECHLADLHRLAGSCGSSMPDSGQGRRHG